MPVATGTPLHPLGTEQDALQREWRGVNQVVLLPNGFSRLTIGDEAPKNRQNRLEIGRLEGGAGKLAAC